MSTLSGESQGQVFLCCTISGDLRAHRDRTISFFYDGARVQDEDTPESLDLEDGDSIEVQLEREWADDGDEVLGVMLVLTSFNLQRSEGLASERPSRI